MHFTFVLVRPYNQHAWTFILIIVFNQLLKLKKMLLKPCFRILSMVLKETKQLPFYACYLAEYSNKWWNWNPIFYVTTFTCHCLIRYLFTAWVFLPLTRVKMHSIWNQWFYFWLLFTVLFNELSFHSDIYGKGSQRLCLDLFRSLLNDLLLSCSQIGQTRHTMKSTFVHGLLFVVMFLGKCLAKNLNLDSISFSCFTLVTPVSSTSYNWLVTN